MPYIKSSFIERLLERVDIVEVISSRVKLKRSSSNTYMACCPFHNEKTPSFSVHQLRQFYNCFGCHKGGNAINFIEAYDHVTFPEAVEIVAEFAGMEVEYEDRGDFHDKTKNIQKLGYIDYVENAARFYEQELYKHQIALDYLKTRNITKETVLKYHIGFAPEGWDFILSHVAKNDLNIQKMLLDIGLLSQSQTGKAYDTFRNRLMIPIRDKRGRTVAFGGRVLDNSKPKYINSKESVIYKKGYELFNLDYVRKLNRDQVDYIIVTEGYMDVIILDQYGIHNAVASLGTATTTEQIAILLKQTDHIKFCYDGDDAGRNAAWRVLENSLSEVDDEKIFSFCFLPPEHDPDSYVRTYGAEKTREMFEKSISFVDYIVSVLTSKYDVTDKSERIKLLNEAAILFSKIPDSAVVTKESLKTEFANATFVTKEDINKIFEAKKQYVNTNSGSNYKNSQHLNESSNLSNNYAQQSEQGKFEISKYQLLVSQLIRNPHYYAQIPEPEHCLDLVKKYSQEKTEILERVLQKIQSKQDISTGALMSIFQQEPAVFNFISYLISLKEASQTNDFNIKVVDLLQIIKDLLVEALEARNKFLLSKINSSQSLTVEEQAEFDFLTKKMHEL